MKVVEYHTEQGFQTVIVAPKQKYLHVVMVDKQVTVKKVPHSEEKYMTELSYPLRRAKRIMRDTGRRIGITKEAKKLMAVNS